jgi:hypothetical protein
MGLDEWAVGDQCLAVAHTHAGGSVLGLQRMPRHECTAAAALVGECVNSCHRVVEARVIQFGPLTVVDQQHVLHMSSSTRVWPVEENDE